MKTKDVINYLESNGGYNMHHLRHQYKMDRSKLSFNKWFVLYIMVSENVSRYIATKVADYYLY